MNGTSQKQNTNHNNVRKLKIVLGIQVSFTISLLVPRGHFVKNKKTFKAQKRYLERRKRSFDNHFLTRPCGTSNTFPLSSVHNANVRIESPIQWGTFQLLIIRVLSRATPVGTLSVGRTEFPIPEKLQSRQKCHS